MRKLIRMGKYSILKKKNDLASDKKKNIEKPIPSSILEVKKMLREIFKHSSDFVLREAIQDKKGSRIIVAYTDGLVDKQVLNQDILRPMITYQDEIVESFSKGNENLVDLLKYNILSDCEVEISRDFDTTIMDILSGDALLYMDEYDIALKLCVKGWAERGVETPETEGVVRGPREGFTESIRTNTSLIRRKIKSPNLKMEQLIIGEQTSTAVCICYIKGIANKTIVDEVRKRLEEIKIDGILESGYIEEFIEDHPYSIFPTMGNSEKPDIIAGKILEGRIAIICDGTPFVLTLPHLFLENLQFGEDYYFRHFFSSIIRLLRVISLILTSIAPALYVALLSFHSGAIPFQLLLSIAASREGVPFSSFFEAIIMILAFEFLREAGIRMPQAVGQAVSIVGALILGEAAVNAGVASDLLIIIIALTAITSFIVGPLSNSITFVRLFLLVSANAFGILGLVLSGYIILAHMCSLRSFGVPYMAPFAPLNVPDLKDTYIRLPIPLLKTRPRVIMWGNKDNVKNRTRNY